MNWQTVLIIYCIWMMAMSVVSIALNVRHTRKHFEQGEKLMIEDGLISQQKEIQKRIEQIIEKIERELP